MATNRFSRRDSRSVTSQQKMPLWKRMQLSVSGKGRWGKNRRKRGLREGRFWARFRLAAKGEANESTTGAVTTAGLGERLLKRLPQVAILVVAAAIPVVMALGYRYLTHTPSLALREVLVEGNARVTPSEIMDAGGLTHGPNLLALDLAEVETGLVGHPWIRAATVERILPDRLRIKISERKPAVLLSMGALYLVDQHGDLFERVSTGQNYSLPVVTGIERAQLLGDRGAERAERMQRYLLQAIALTEQWKNSELGKQVQVSEVRVDPLLGYSVILGDGANKAMGAEVWLGHKPTSHQFEKLMVLLTDANRRERILAEIHLDDERDPNRISVRFRSDTEREQELLEGEDRNGGASNGQKQTKTTIVAQGLNKQERE